MICIDTQNVTSNLGDLTAQFCSECKSITINFIENAVVYTLGSTTHTRQYEVEDSKVNEYNNTDLTEITRSLKGMEGDASKMSVLTEKRYRRIVDLYGKSHYKVPFFGLDVCVVSQMPQIVITNVERCTMGLLYCLLRDPVLQPIKVEANQVSADSPVGQIVLTMRKSSASQMSIDSTKPLHVQESKLKRVASRLARMFSPML